MTRRLPALVAGLAAVTAVGACSISIDRPGDGDGPTSGASSASSDAAGTPSSSSAATPPEPEAPDFGGPLGDDVTEAQLQTLLEEHRLPPGPAHGGTFETMTNALAEQPAHDVMLFGDSMTQQGIDPAQLGARLSDRAGREVTVFNAGSSRARWGINRMIGRYALERQKLPRVAVLVISTRGGDRDYFYDREVQKTPFSHAVEGCDRPASEEWDAAAVADCKEDVSDLRHRYRDAGGQVEWALEGRPLQQGYTSADGVRLRPDGMLEHPSVSAAEAERISEQRNDGAFPGFPDRNAEAMEQYRELADLLRAHGVTVISTEIPYTPPHQENLTRLGYTYDANRGARAPRDYDVTRQEASFTISSYGGTPHYPVSSFGDWWGDGSSRDAIHLAPEGAKDFADQLVDDTPGFADAVVAGLDD